MTKEEFLEEIEKERKWLDSAGYNAYNIDVAFSTIIKKVKDQEPKTGHWIDTEQGRWIYAKCSECGTVHDVASNYCPNCGARMKGE